KTEITGSLDAAGLRMRVNALERMARPDTWVNSFWKLADPLFHNSQGPILDADSGREHMCQIQYLGHRARSSPDQALKCYHFRITGGAPSPVDVWFDESQHLVRQEFVEQGHRTVVHATGIRRS